MTDSRATQASSSPEQAVPEWITVGVQRWSQVAPFLAIGALSILAGGLVAAVAGPSGFDDGSWLAAFLVLVGGVAQILLGGAQAVVTESPPSPKLVRSELLTWNLAVVGVILGTLGSMPVLTSIAGLVTVAALLLFLFGAGAISQRMHLIAVAYRTLIAVVLVSTPIGLVLAWIRRS